MRDKFLIAIMIISAVGALPGCADKAAQARSGTIAMSVTEDGFEPADIKLKKGAPVKLTITRKTEKTCAKEIVIDEYKIHTMLPLNTAVAVSFTPTKSGQLRYGCAMDKMVGGVFSIE
jgi:plastocyanin domain-containing protein